MKRLRHLLLAVLVILLLVGGCGLWVRQVKRLYALYRQYTLNRQHTLDRQYALKRQYMLNRQLIAVLLNHSPTQAIRLVKEGADPNTRYKPAPAVGPTALLMACGVEPEPILDFFGYFSLKPDETDLLCTLLAHGANINGQDAVGTTPLMFAVSTHEITRIRLLVEHGADTNVQNHEGYTALHIAVQSHDRKILADKTIIALLLAHGAAPNRPDKRGVTPLQEAQAAGFSDIVALLRKGSK